MEDRMLHVAVSLLGGLSCRERNLVAETSGTTDVLFLLSKGSIEEIIGRRLRGKLFRQDWRSEAERIVRFSEKGEFRLIMYWDADYPPQLREIYNPPYLLYLKGRLPGGELPYAALVGTRRPAEFAEQAAFVLGAELSLSGFPIVSGLAVGIDAAAHWGAVKTGGVTVAVEASGIDRVYPSCHRRLAAEIVEGGGGLLTEYPPGTGVRRFRFPERNRLISGLSRAVIVVQAPKKSGALITADYALEQGRDLMVHRRGLGGTAGEGGRRLAEEGAEIIEDSSEVTAEWPVLSPALVPVDRNRDSASKLLEEELDGRIIRFSGRQYRSVG